jgi:hypothetical protein
MRGIEPPYSAWEADRRSSGRPRPTCTSQLEGQDWALRSYPPEAVVTPVDGSSSHVLATCSSMLLMPTTMMSPATSPPSSVTASLTPSSAAASPESPSASTSSAVTAPQRAARVRRVLRGAARPLGTTHPTAGAPHRRVDQRAEGGHRYDTVIRKEICLRKVAIRRAEKCALGRHFVVVPSSALVRGGRQVPPWL